MSAPDLCPTRRLAGVLAIETATKINVQVRGVKISNSVLKSESDDEDPFTASGISGKDRDGLFHTNATAMAPRELVVCLRTSKNKLWDSCSNFERG